MIASEKETCATHSRDYFEEYCHASTIHGFRYFGEKRSIYERLIWVLIFATSLGGCIFMILLVYSRYEYSPFIVSFATKETSIYDIPFPAVTICPQIKASRKYTYTKLRAKVDAGNATDRELTYFQALSMLCETRDKYERLPNVDEYNMVKDLPSIFHKIKPHFNSFGCKFLGQETPCSDLFMPILTDEGVCYTFNIMSHNEIFTNIVQKFKDYHNAKYNSSWSLEGGYKDRAEVYAYPRRALLSGIANGLTINIITVKDDLDVRCRSGEGYKAALHNPMRFPQLKQEFIRIPLDESVLAAGKPSMITTSHRVKLYSLEKRDCVFPNERKLSYYKYYTQNNCYLECLTNFMLEKCGCVSFYLPRTNYTKICAYQKIKCMKEAEIALHNRELDAEVKKDVTSCNCIPICTELHYNIESSETTWKWRYYVPDDLKQFRKKIYLSRLIVYIKIDDFLTSERSEMYGWNDFLANFGGLLSLFTGFSVLSAVEMIYFLTFRMFFNVRLYGHWAGRVDREPV